MKKTILAALLLTLPMLANAANEQRGPMNGGMGKPHDFMENLTDDQKACIQKQGCQMPDMKNDSKKMGKPADGEKPQMPKMTDDEKAKMDANRECMDKAFKTCGIEMPARPEGNTKPAVQQRTSR
jgi:hypothetical protein